MAGCPDYPWRYGWFLLLETPFPYYTPLFIQVLKALTRTIGLLVGIPKVHSLSCVKWCLSAEAPPPVFAHQGYFAVFINPTGSTTFGQGKLAKSLSIHHSTEQ